MTPMLQQYFQLKQEAEDAIVFFRMGDFYEIFGEDAEEIAPKLDVVLTAREKGDQTKIPFCGVPHHAATGYWLKLIRMGYKVAIVEQLEDPKETKGLVKRGIVRTYTPGCIDELEGLERDEPNYLVAYMENTSDTSIAAVDVSTGEFRIGAVAKDQLVSTLRLFRPKEILTRRFLSDSTKTLLNTHFNGEQIHVALLPEAPLKDIPGQDHCLKSIFGSSDLSRLDCKNEKDCKSLIASVIAYIQSLKSTTSQFLRIDPLHNPDTMVLSETAIRDLELFETARRRDSQGSLARTINRTLTPMGSRSLRYSLSHPFAKREPILARHNAISSLIGGGEGCLADLRSELKHAADLARLTTRLISGSTSPHELTLIRTTLQLANRVADILKKIGAQSKHLVDVSTTLATGLEAMSTIQKALVDEPVALGSGRGVFRDGYDSELDQKAALANSGEQEVEAYEQKLRSTSGISSLKIKDHKTFGLLIEVTKSNLSKVPPNFIRRQTMVNCERFTTIELNDLTESLSSAFDKAVTREADLFRQLIERLSPFKATLMEVSSAVAEIDLLQGFAWIAIKEGWSKPTLSDENNRLLTIKGGRHPVVEHFVGRHQFFANDVQISSEERHLLITGPNMAGKSTIMRQTAIIAILCQAGGFVPAKSTVLPLFDRIFTRVGAADDLSRGQSTFMVEMSEAAEILRLATDKSLVILDEVGRGTSTSDGLAIASAILEDLADRVRCFTMFATHYHELVSMMAHRSSVKPVQTEVIEKDNSEIIFTHRLVPGGASSSFGIEVARLAGVPLNVLERAKAQIQGKSQNHSVSVKPVSKVQAELFGLSTDATIQQQATRSKDLPNMDQLVLRLECIKIHRTTPLQALNILDELKRLLVPQSQRSLFDQDSSAHQ